MSDISQIITNLSAAYPSFRPENAEEMLKLWERRLSAFDQAVLDLAVDTVIEQAKYFPSLNEFLKVCNTIRDMRQVQARQEIKQRIMDTNELRVEQIDLETDAADGLYDPLAWEEMATKWANAGRDYAAQACREKSARLAKSLARLQGARK